MSIGKGTKEELKNDARHNLHINMMGINELPVYLFLLLYDLLTRQVLLFILMHRFFYIITNTHASTSIERSILMIVSL